MHFQGSADLNSGANNIAIVGTDAQPATQTENQIVHVNGPGSSTPTFDANGNMLSDGTNDYVWDAENRLIRIDYPNAGDSSEFLYDPMGRNIQIVENVSSTPVSTKQFVWCKNDRCEERDDMGAVTQQFFANGQIIGSNPYFYNLDHLGSIREMNDGSGDIQAQYSFDPYGSTKLIFENVRSDFKFAKYYNHNLSNLNFTYYRSYDSELGCWLSRDPIENFVKGINNYSYTAGDPVNRIDPLGLFATNACFPHGGNWFTLFIKDMECMCDRCSKDAVAKEECKREAKRIANGLRDVWARLYYTDAKCYTYANDYQSSIGSSNSWGSMKLTTAPFGWNGIQSHTFLEIYIKEPNGNATKCSFWVDSAFAGNGLPVHPDKPPIPKWWFDIPSKPADNPG